MGAWKGLVAIGLAVFLSACQDEAEADIRDGGGEALSGASMSEAGPEVNPEAGTDRVVEIVTAQVSTACLDSLPAPSVRSETPARVTLNLENFSHDVVDGRQRFAHDRRFRETSGIGLTIYRGKVCVENGATCADACVRYRVEPGESLTQRGHHFATPLTEDSITLQYWARDDAGHDITFQRRIETVGGEIVSID